MSRNTAATLRVTRLFTLLGYFGLLLVLPCWHAWLAPPAHIPVALVLIVLVVPLLVPLRGLLHGRPYTHAWVPLLAIFYLTIGVSEAVANPAQRTLALVQTAFSLMLLIGASWYVRSITPRANR